MSLQQTSRPVRDDPPEAADAGGQDAAFRSWLAGVREEALERGISGPTLDAALGGARLVARVIELDRSQPESTITYETYERRVLSPQRIAKGRELFARHRRLLTEIGSAYGVQPQFLVALWGIETDYGGFTGGFHVISALASLAYDGRRSAYFRGELMHALKIVDDGHIDPDKMHGSWAGAMGQSQFMPSSFVDYAVDYDGDGAKDIWNTLPDVFASAANYLKSVGWRDDIGWGQEVLLPDGFDHGLTGLESQKRVAEWRALGIRAAGGGAFAGDAAAASVVLPDGEGGRAFLVYENFRTTLRWNRSLYFATAVGLLSDLIAGKS